MDASHKTTFRIVILAFGLIASAALAGNEEDMDRANDLYDAQHMVDAFAIFKKLAEQNYLPAQARLGEILDYTEEDEEAAGWYIMAASQGSAAGAFGLGKMYLSGEGVKKDSAQALHWITFAAEKDDLNAVKALESAYRIGSSSGMDVPLDLKQAEFWEAKKTPLDAAQKKVDEKKRQATLKAIYEKQEARKKADKEAAEKAGKGQTK